MHLSPRVLHFQYPLHLPTSKFNHDIARKPPFVPRHEASTNTPKERRFCTLQRPRTLLSLVALQPSHHRYDLISSRGKRMRERRFIRPTPRRSALLRAASASSFLRFLRFAETGRRAESRGMRNARGIHVSKGVRTHLSGSADREKRDQSIPSWGSSRRPPWNDAILCPLSLRCTPTDLDVSRDRADPRASMSRLHCRPYKARPVSSFGGIFVCIDPRRASFAFARALNVFRTFIERG